MSFGKKAIKELPVVSEEATVKGNPQGNLEGEKGNDESLKASPQCPDEAGTSSTTTVVVAVAVAEEEAEEEEEMAVSSVEIPTVEVREALETPPKEA